MNLKNDYFDERVSELSQEDFEVLKTLNGSPYWKYYRQLLIKAKEAYFQSILPMNDPNEVLKHVGIVAGINFAINQLPVLLAQHEAKMMKKLAKEGLED